MLKRQNGVRVEAQAPFFFLSREATGQIQNIMLFLFAFVVFLLPFAAFGTLAVEFLILHAYVLVAGTGLHATFAVGTSLFHASLAVLAALFATLAVFANHADIIAGSLA